MMLPTDLTLSEAALRVFPNVVLFDGGRYVFATLLLTLVLVIAHRLGFAARIIQQRRPGRADLVRELTTSLRTVLVFALAATPVLWVRSSGYGAQEYAGPTGPLVTTGFVMALLVVHDAWFYWTHRLIHRPRLFRLWHRTHHKTITPTPFTAYAFDWREALVQVTMPLAWQFVVPTPDDAMFIFLAIMIVRNAWGHCGTELHPRGFADHWFWQHLTTTTHHDLHHSGGFGCNFGLYFTWWDRMMETEHPRYREIFREITERPLARRSMHEPRDHVPVAPADLHLRA